MRYGKGLLSSSWMCFIRVCLRTRSVAGSDVAAGDVVWHGVGQTAHSRLRLWQTAQVEDVSR
jgi:hypothetical protein